VPNVVVARRHLLLTAATAVLAGCDNPFTAVTYRYRLKVIVEVDGQAREGSSVMQVRILDRTGMLLNPVPYVAKTWGEAVVIDLGPRHGLLFALITRPGMGRYLALLPRACLHPQSVKADDVMGAARARAAMRDEVTVPPDMTPIFVRFDDITDPATMHQLPAEDLQSAYGAGVSLARVTLQVTDDALTHRIDSLLPWLDAQAATGPNSDTNLIGMGGFKLVEF
jgi:hypothetical protein